METKGTNQIKAIGALTFLAGAWLMIAPLTLTLSGGALWNQLIAGAFLFFAGLAEMINPRGYVTSLVVGIVGAWLIVGQYAISVSSGVALNQVIVGAIAVVLAVGDAVRVNRLAPSHA